jgi:hypothetical protein
MKAAYSSPLVQSELVTDHLHFVEQQTPQGNSAQGLAKPSRASFEGDCRSRFGDDSRRHRDTGLSMALYSPAAGLYLPETPFRERSLNES